VAFFLATITARLLSPILGALDAPFGVIIAIGRETGADVGGTVGGSVGVGSGQFQQVVYRWAIRGCPSRRHAAIWAWNVASKGGTSC
jgi:hypothetical protein